MTRAVAILFSGLLALAACELPSEFTGGPTPGTSQVYRIDRLDPADVQFRMRDSINALRKRVAAPALTLNAQLNAAAETHSRDMLRQNRPWHFGSDGSSPLERIKRAGYPGQLLGENISESFETETQTVNAWMETQETRAVLLDRAARDVGIAWEQGQNGKIWWTLITGTRAAPRQVVAPVAEVSTVAPAGTQQPAQSGGVPDGGFSAEQFLNQ